jgi:hypothetical protein
MANKVMFKIVVRRDKKSGHFANVLREQVVSVPIEIKDGGFSIEIHHQGHLGDGERDQKPIEIQGFIGDDLLSTTVQWGGSPRIKRTTPR